MTVYLDTSDLVKLYMDEPGSERVANLVRDADVVVTSLLAYPEARATFARQRRDRHITAHDAARAVSQLDADWPNFVTLTLDQPMALAAGRLAESLGVRGGDAVHLAAFETLVARSVDADVRFSSADARLRRAAKSLG